jgi:hypothetical protein
VNTNTGGPAFPVPNDANVNEQEGMTLRDYFAAKAMQAIITGSLPHGTLEYRDAATAGYRFADAMLAERDK